MKRFAFVGVCVLAFGAGCHHNTAVKTTPVAEAPPPTAQTQAPVQSQAVSPNVAVSDDLARQCQLDTQGDATAAPKFSYNDAELLPEDRDVLAKIATCVTTGPLKGKKLQLVGRADPRGTEEYNMGLGTRRAGMVDQYLVRLGVHNGQLASTTRGALDANGTVDVRLM
jgi:peptidoglycan-associated lipoprotein